MRLLARAGWCRARQPTRSWRPPRPLTTSPLSPSASTRRARAALHAHSAYEPTGSMLCVFKNMEVTWQGALVVVKQGHACMLCFRRTQDSQWCTSPGACGA